MGSLVQMGLSNALLAGALAVVALVVGRLSRRPALVHSLWVLVLLKLVTPPLVSLPVPGWQVAQTPDPLSSPDTERPRLDAEAALARIATSTREPGRGDAAAPVMKAEDLARQLPRPVMPASPADVMVPDDSPAVTLVSDPAEPPAQAAPPADVARPDLLAMAGWFWLAGASLSLLWNVCRVARFQCLLRFARPAPSSLQQLTAELAARLGLSRSPEVFLLPGPVPPLLWAVGGRARLFFPASLLPRLPGPERATLITHELAHLARRDHWIRWLELLAGCLFWWYPLLWLARHQLRVAEEECCDAWVINELPEFRPAYAGALLETIDFLSRVPAPLPPAASGFGRVYHLKRRLTMIVRGTTPRGLSWLGKFVVLALAVGLPMMPSPGRTAAPPTSKEAEKKDDKSKASAAQAPGGEEPGQYQPNPRVFVGGGGQVWQAAVSPDGKTLAVVAGGTGENEGALTLYDLPEGKERVTLGHVKPLRCVAFSRDGKHLATGDFNQTAQLRDPKTGEVRVELKGHTASVNALAFTPDSARLVTAGLDKTLKVWQVSDGKNVGTLQGHTDWVLHVSISPDGKTMLSTSKDMTARVWDVGQKFTTRHVLKGHTGWVESGACSPDNKTVATFGLEGAVKIWDATTGKILHDLTGHSNGVLGGVFLDEGKQLATTSYDSNVRIVEVSSGNVVQTLPTGHTTSTYALAATPDGKMLVTGSWDKSAKLWDASTREEKKTLVPRRYAEETTFPLLTMACSPDGKVLAVGGEEKPVKLIDATNGSLLHLLEGHEDKVSGVSFSTDGKTLATAGFDGVVILWDVATGKPRHKLTGHENAVFAVAFSPDGKWLASAGEDKTVRLWDPGSGKQIEKLDKKHRGSVRCLSWSPDSKRLASAGIDKSVRVWDLEKKEVVHVLRGHEDLIRGLAFLPDGKHLLSGSEDQTVRLWDVASEKQLSSYSHNDVIRGIVLSPRGRSLVVVAQDRSMRILDPMTLGQRMIQYAHSDAVTCAAFTPDARGLYTGGTDKTIRLWQSAVEARSPLLTFRDSGAKQMWVSSYSPDGKWLVTGGADRALRVRPAMAQGGTRPWSLEGLDRAVYSVVVSPDGATLAVGLGGNQVGIYDRKSGKRKALLGEGGKNFHVWMTAFSPDGKKLATVSGSWAEAAEPGEAKVWDLTTNKEIGNLPEHTAPVMALAWSKDGKHLVTGARDGSARLIDAGTLKEKHELKGHKDAARFAIFSPDDRYVATASFDGTVKLWATAGGAEVASLKVSDKGANCVAWSPDGKLLAAVPRPDEQQQGPGEVKLWDVTSEEKGPAFKERATLKGHSARVLACAFSPDNKSLVSTGGQFSQFGETIVWDVATSKERMLLHGHRYWCEALTFAKDGTLYTGGGVANARGEVRAWQINPPGWEVKDAHPGEITCAAWSKDGKTLATGCTKTGIKVWDAATGKVKTELSGHKKMIRSLAFSPDGKTLASASSDSTVRLWDLEGEAEPIELARLQRDATSVAFSPDGNWLATSSADPSFQVRTGDVKVFDVKTGKERAGGEWANVPAMSVAFSPDGKFLAAGGGGTNQLRVFDVASGKRLLTVNGANSIRAIAWSPDSKRIAATHGQGSQRGNGSIQVWDAANGREVMALVGHTSLCLGLSYSPDGTRLASASNDGTAKVWDLVGPPITITATARAVPTPKD